MARGELGGDDAVGLSSRNVGFISNLSVGLSDIISKTFEFGDDDWRGMKLSGSWMADITQTLFKFGVVWGGTKLGGALILASGVLTVLDGNTGRHAGFEGAIGGAPSWKLTRPSAFLLCCNLRAIG
jgi:hypothetical protein